MQINRRIIQQILLVLYFLLSYNEVQGKRKLSEDQELERQLELLNKPAIKTIKTKYGDIYNCVDFYKQPAFDHPSLRNHNFHPKMKPTLSRIKQTSGTSKSNEPSTIWLKDRGCPFGSVPIKRVTKDDLIRQNLMSPPEDAAFHSRFSKISNHSELKRRFLSAQGYRVAIVSTLNDWNNKFGGAGMTSTVWNPYVEGLQHSGCRVKVQKESDIIQVGWRVDPTLYGDAKTRMFIHFQAGNKHCFNTLCPGFVQVNDTFPIEAPLDKVSQRGDLNNIWEYSFYIDRDLVNGNWWLLVGKNYEELGFWPQHIFTHLASFATNVEWGGVAYSPPGIPEPPMGSGFFPLRRFGYDGSCYQMTVLDYRGDTMNVNTISHTDDPNIYKVYDLSSGTSRHTVYYGGPGERPYNITL